MSFLYTEIRYTLLCIWKRTDKDFKLVTESVNSGGICCHSFCVALEAWKISNVTDSQLHCNLTDTVHKQRMCVVSLKRKIISRWVRVHHERAFHRDKMIFNQLTLHSILIQWSLKVGCVQPGGGGGVCVWDVSWGCRKKIKRVGLAAI